MLQYDRHDIYSEPTHGALLKYERGYHACTIFHSPAHNKRSVVIVAGGDPGNNMETAEIWDHTVDGSAWQESELISTIFIRVALNYTLL